MCALAPILAIASSAIGAVGQIQQGRAASAAANYQAKVNERNAQINEMRARDAVERGMDAEQMQRRKNAQVLGQQTAAMAANGLDLSFGSPLDTLVDTKTAGDLDALTIRTSAEREAYDYRIAAMNDMTQAGMSRAEAKNAKSAGFLAAAGTVLTGAGDAFGKYRTSMGAIR